MKVPHYYRWMALALTVVFQASTFGFLSFCFTFWVEPWAREFGVSITRVVLISGVMMLVMGGCSALVGRVLDRFPTNCTVSAGLLIFASGLWLGSIAQSYIQVFIVYAIVLPCAVSLTGTLASQSIAVKWFSGHKQLGLAIGIAAMGISVGGIVLPGLVAEGLTDHDWRWIFQRAGLFLGLIVAPVMFVLLSPKPPASTEAVDTHGRQREPQQAPAIPIKQLLTNPYFLIPILAFFLDGLAFSSFSNNAASFMKSIDLGVKDTAAAISTLATVMLVAKLLMGKLTDWLHYKTLFIMAAICNGAGLTIFSLGNPDIVLLGVVLLGLGGGGLIPLQAKIVSIHFGAANFSQAFGFFVFLQMISVFGAPLLSYFYELFGSYRQPFMIMAGLVLIAMTLMMLLKREPVAELGHA